MPVLSLPIETLDRIFFYTFTPSLRRREGIPHEPTLLRGPASLLFVSRFLRQLILPLIFKDIIIHTGQDWVTLFDPQEGLLVAGEEGEARWKLVRRLIINFDEATIPTDPSWIPSTPSLLVPLTIPTGGDMKEVVYLSSQYPRRSPDRARLPQQELLDREILVVRFQSAVNETPAFIERAIHEWVEEDAGSELDSDSDSNTHSTRSRSSDESSSSSKRELAVVTTEIRFQISQLAYNQSAYIVQHLLLERIQPSHAIHIPLAQPTFKQRTGSLSDDVVLVKLPPHSFPIEKVVFSRPPLPIIQPVEEDTEPDEEPYSEWEWILNPEDYLRLRNWTRRFPLAGAFELGDGTARDDLEKLAEEAREWVNEDEEDSEKGEEMKEPGEDVSLDFESWTFLNVEAVEPSSKPSESA